MSHQHPFRRRSSVALPAVASALQLPVVPSLLAVARTPFPDSLLALSWTIRTLAIKLAGPIARILQTGGVLEWDTLRYSGEYHTDFEAARTSCFRYLNVPDDHSENPDVDTMMNEAARVAIQCIRRSKPPLLRAPDLPAVVEAFGLDVRHNSSDGHCERL